MIKMNLMKVLLLLNDFKFELEPAKKEKYFRQNYIQTENWRRAGHPQAEISTLSTVNFFNLHEFGNFPKCNNWHLKLVRSNPETLERIVMHFWP